MSPEEVQLSSLDWGCDWLQRKIRPLFGSTWSETEKESKTLCTELVLSSWVKNGVSRLVWGQSNCPFSSTIVCCVCACDVAWSRHSSILTTLVRLAWSFLSPFLCPSVNTRKKNTFTRGNGWCHCCFTVDLQLNLQPVNSFSFFNWLFNCSQLLTNVSLFPPAVANHWIRENGQIFKRPCTLNPDEWSMASELLWIHCTTFFHSSNWPHKCCSGALYSLSFSLSFISLLASSKLFRSIQTVYSVFQNGNSINSFWQLHFKNTKWKVFSPGNQNTHLSPGHTIDSLHLPLSLSTEWSKVIYDQLWSLIQLNSIFYSTQLTTQLKLVLLAVWTKWRQVRK